MIAWIEKVVKEWDQCNGAFATVCHDNYLDGKELLKRIHDVKS